MNRGSGVKIDAKNNITVIDKNYLDIYGGNKQLVRPFRRQAFWKCIVFILSEVTHGKKKEYLGGGPNHC